jgi:hypothetical protein
MTTCQSIKDKIYNLIGEDSIPFLVYLEISVHILFCPRCAEELKNLKAAEDIMRNGFFPPSPDIEDAIMAKLPGNVADRGLLGMSADDEELSIVDVDIDSSLAHPDFSLGPSFRRWVIIGIIILVSLSTVFFGMDFENIVRSQGSAFLIPVGITVGVVLTCYGAFFIASHLKELSDRFGLH